MILAKAIPDCNRILVAEDNEMQAQLLQEGLTRAGFIVDVVSGGLEAVAKIEDNNYDAVLLDYNIPEIDGLAVARVIGDFLGPLARPVMIGLTAAPERITARETGTKSAFDLVLDKSCGLLTLIFRMNHLIELAPHTAERRAIRDSLDRQAELDDLNGPLHDSVNRADRERVSILIVEDNELQQSLLRDILEGRGYAVEVASDGLQALRRIRRKCFDLVIIDYRVPELDGVAVASLVHDQMAQAWRPRLIAFTASPDLLRSRISANALVFDDIVDKSSDVDALLSAIDRLLRASPNPMTRRLAASVEERSQSFV